MKTKEQINEHISDLISFELERAREKFPKLTNSPHEGFAVLKEEIDKLDVEIVLIIALKNILWKSVRDDNLDSQKETLSKMKISTIRLLKEAIQVGAIIDKYNQDIFN